MTVHRPLPRRLIFFTELEKEPLSELFSKDSPIDQLTRLQASVSMGMLDLSAERAACTQTAIRCTDIVYMVIHQF